MNEGRWIPEYECDRCGACCIPFSVRVSAEDRAREPLLELLTVKQEPNEDGDKWLSYSERPDWGNEYDVPKVCPCFQSDGTCQIHATKPHACSVFKPGSEGCQWARGLVGLGMLEPVRWNERWDWKEKECP